jgi:hypothetical protein
MNKFLENVEAIQSNQQVKYEYPIMSAQTHIEEDRFNTDIQDRRLYDYRIYVRLGHTVTCPVEELEHHKKEIQLSIAHFVYGDIERRLCEWFYSNNMRTLINYKQCEEFFEILKDMR